MERNTKVISFNLLLATEVIFFLLVKYKLLFLHFDSFENLDLKLICYTFLDSEIFRQFKLCGLSIQMDARHNLKRVLENEMDFNQALDDVLRNIKDRIERREISSSVITSTIIESVVIDRTEDVNELQMASTQVFDAFNSPKLIYNEQQKTYSIITNKNSSTTTSSSSSSSLSNNDNNHNNNSTNTNTYNKIKLHDKAITKANIYRECLHN